MKLTKNQLRKMIKEEIVEVITENDGEDDGRIALQKLPAMDHAGYSDRVDADEPPARSRDDIARILLDDRQYRISQKALDGIWKILEKAVRVHARFGPEVWDIHGKLADEG